VRDRRVPLEHAVDDRFAVLRFTDLEVGRLGGRLDEVAGGVDVEQAKSCVLKQLYRPFSMR
jgi:hypothetical protein